MMLLTADWHLTDLPQDEYRWKVFVHVSDWMRQHKDNNQIFVLGDITDRKDRHSAQLVNRLVTEFKILIDAGAVIYVLMGNHDKPLTGTPYWTFLSQLSGYLTFVTKPHAMKNVVLLPYSDDPAEEWKNIRWSSYDLVLMHQTVTGAKGNNGIKLENPKMISFPKGCIVYSGDIHTTQRVRNVTYVGAPHPVAFGDDYPSQMIELDEEFTETVIKLKTIQKLVLRIADPADLNNVSVSKSDQVRVVCTIDISDLDRWPSWQDMINSWAALHGVILASVEPDIIGTYLADENAETPTNDNDPAYILRLFADAEEIDDRMFEAGVALLKEVFG